MMNIGEKYAWLRRAGDVGIASANTGSYHCVWTSHGGIHVTSIGETYNKAVENVFEDVKMSLFNRCL